MSKLLINFLGISLILITVVLTTGLYFMEHEPEAITESDSAIEEPEEYTTSNSYESYYTKENYDLYNRLLELEQKEEPKKETEKIQGTPYKTPGLINDTISIDPEWYDNELQYAEDAWGVDFDTYEDAIDFYVNYQ